MLEAVDNISKRLNRNKPEETYSLGLYEGRTPFVLYPSLNTLNPILSRSDFSSESVNFVADPFAIFENGLWYLFYELMEVDSRKGKLCVSISEDMYTWTEGQTILEEPFHLSYPEIFKSGEDFYLVPESHESNEVRLYKAVDFPFKWSFEKVLLHEACVDTTIHFKDDLWWMFTCDSPHEHNGLRLYYSDELHGEWKEHPQSPIYKNNVQNSRPAGKLLEYNNKLYRFSQDCKSFYGHSVRAFEVITMNKNVYIEKEIDINPYLAGGTEKWNRVSMHHVDIHKIRDNHWVAFVDGRTH